MMRDIKMAAYTGVVQETGWRVAASRDAPRHGAVIMDEERVIVTHPDEEHMVWALLGDVDYAFKVLDEAMRRRIALAAAKAQVNVRTWPFDTYVVSV